MSSSSTVHMMISVRAQHARRAARLPVAALLCLAAACGGKQRVAGVDSGPGEDARVDPVAQADAGSVSSELMVEVSATETTLCKGDCTELTIHAEHAEAELTYEWLSGASGREPGQQVCPTETTVYRVRAKERTDNSAEFARGGRSVEDQLTVTVKDCTAPGSDALLCEKRFRFDEIDATKGAFGASKPWLALSMGVQQHTDTDAEGNLLLAGAFGGRIDLGDGEHRATSGANGVLFKLDPECNVLWSRALVATAPGDALVPLGMGVDAGGNTLVVSVAGPTFDLTFLTTSTLTFGTELLVHKISPAGDTLHTTRFAMGPGIMVQDLSVLPSGAVYFSGMAHSFSDLGDGPLGISPTAFYSFLLGLDPSGNRILAQSQIGAYRIAAGDEMLLIQRGLWEALDLLDPLTGNISGNLKPVSLLALGYPDWRERWRLPLETGVYHLKPLSGGRFVHLTVQNGGYGDDATGETVRQDKALLTFLDRTGTPSSPVSILDRQYREPPFDADAGIGPSDLYDTPMFAQLEVGNEDVLAVAGSFSQELTLHGTSLMAQGKPDVFVAKLAADGKLSWARSLSWGERSFSAGLSLAPEGDVFVTGTGIVPGGSGEYDVVISKLRGTP